MKALLNGAEPQAETLLNARALHYGDGVFRTLLCWEGQPLDMPLHLERQHQDCVALGLEMPAAAMLRQEAEQLCAGAARAVLKIICWRRATGRGYAPGSGQTDRLLQLTAAPQYPASHWESGVCIGRSPVTLAEQPLLAGVKHLNRLEQVLASRDWPEGTAEMLMGTAQGEVICGTRSNLFCVRDGQLLTPDLSRAGVRGLMRQRILEWVSNAQVTTLRWADLERAEEMFLSNSLLGIWPVRAFESHRYAAPGPFTQRLMQQLQHPRLS